MKNSLQAICGMLCMSFAFGESEGMIKLGCGNNSQNSNFQTPSDDEDGWIHACDHPPMNLNTKLMTLQKRMATLAQLEQRENDPRDTEDLLQTRGEIAYLKKRWRQQERILQIYARNLARIKEISLNSEYKDELRKLIEENRTLSNKYPRLIFGY